MVFAARNAEPLRIRRECMYRAIVLLSFLITSVLGQIDKPTKRAFASPVFGNQVEGKPFTARYITKRTWLSSAGGEYSEKETGSFFRDSSGRLSKRSDSGVKCDCIQGCDWIQDPVAD